MDFLPVFDLIASFFKKAITVLQSVDFSGFGVSVDLFDIVFSCIVISMVVSVFWKGARG